MRVALRTTVENLEPWDEVERAHRQDVLDWIDSGQPIHRVAKPATPPKHLVAYALLIDAAARSALLIDHRLAGLWLPTGGHVDLDETPAIAAERELGEELGIDGDIAPPWGPEPFFLTVTRTVGQEQHLDVSLWYAFAGSDSLPLVVDEREAVEARWWDFDAIRNGPGSRFDPELPRAIAKLSAGLASYELSARPDRDGLER